MVGLLGAVAAGADCPAHVGDTEDRCIAAPAGYAGLGAANGEACYYAMDCNSGMCAPDGDGNAFCSPRALETTTCEASLGNDWTAMLIPSCSDDLQWTCVKEDGGTDCGRANCDVGELCAAHEDCETELCFDLDEDGQGVCVDYCVTSCNAGESCLEVINNGTDPLYLCVPTS